MAHVRFHASNESVVAGCATLGLVDTTTAAAIEHTGSALADNAIAVFCPESQGAVVIKTPEASQTEMLCACFRQMAADGLCTETMILVSFAADRAAVEADDDERCDIAYVTAFVFESAEGCMFLDLMGGATMIEGPETSTITLS
jgi:hypothetical protein